MFSREEAQARLQSAAIDKWAEKQAARVARLPKSLRLAAEPVFNSRGYIMSYAFDRDLEPWLHLSAAQRHKIFEAAAPGHGDVLERTWQICDRLPYPIGWTRRPFRVVDRPEVYLYRRAQAVRAAASVLARYKGNVPWFAAWSSYFWDDISTMLAAEIDGGGPEADATLSTLLEVIDGTHPFGAVSRSSVRALLTVERPEAWDAVERLVLAAQRQEGIRQAVFESADEVHPEAFKRLARLVVDERLTRFASVVRAFGVWLGLPADVTERKRIDRMLELIVDAVASPEVSRSAAASGDPETVYAGLWSHAFNDASGATAAARGVLESDDGDIRFVATHLLGWINLPESRSKLRDLLKDEDRAIAARAFAGLADGPLEASAYDDLEGYLGRIDKNRKIAAPVWPWIELQESPSAILQLMLGIRGKRHPVAVHPYLTKMDADTRSMYVRQLVGAPGTPESRQALVDLASDRSQWVATRVFKALHEIGITPDEALVFEKLLTRKTGPTRSAAIGMLATLGDDGVIESATRLLSSKKQEQRLGGLELLRQLKDSDRALGEVDALATGYAGERKRLSEAEVTMLEYLAAEDTEEASLDNGLGLFDPGQLAPTTAPSKSRIRVSTTRHQKLLTAADGLIEQHRDTPITVQSGLGTEEKLYGDHPWGLKPRPGDDPADAPLASVWRDWWDQQSAGPQELARCLAAMRQQNWQHHETIARKGLPTLPKVNYQGQLDAALWWLWLEHGTSDGLTFLLDGYENALAMVPARHLKNPLVAPAGWGDHKFDWRANSPAVAWGRTIGQAWRLRPDLRDTDSIKRRWRLESWLDRPVAGAPRHRPSFGLVLEARAAGSAGDVDVLDHLVGPRSESRRGYGTRGFEALRMGTRRRPMDMGGPDAGLGELVAAVRDRVIDVELRRGDVATAASAPALAIRSVSGADRLISLLRALGKEAFLRGWSWNADQKKGVLSHLIRVSYPAETDTPAQFAEMVADSAVTEKRLLELALYAPQWSRYVEHAVGWDGLEDAVYWLHAHTKDNSWSVDADVREAWAAEIAHRTALTPVDLVDGGVDVDWFHRVLDTLGAERWEQLLAFIKYTSGGGGHKRAEMFGEALRGALSVDALMERIRTKRHQDTVRALGLVPLTADQSKRSDEVLARYQLFQEFKQGSRKFGSQKQASEKRAIEIGMDNLARTAGYADPVRLQWDMETLEAGDLTQGPIRLEKSPYLLELGIDTLGKAELAVIKDGKKLKSVPAAIRKDEDVVALRSRATALRRQVSRVRASLEAASIFGDSFTALELERLHHHPVLRPMLAATLFVLPDGTVGIPVDDGLGLRPIGGRKRKIGNRSVRPAHPVDLLASDAWSGWQHRLFVDEVKQPFKQVFRELYVLTAAETDDGKKSLRYAGHQVNPRQAAGLFGSRGWTTHPDGYTFKVFHREGLMAAVDFDGALFTPAEVDGATMYGLTFQRRGEPELVDLEAVPARLFSEVMRDLDLVVSVAHMGGVDPEASASTVEMRTALVRETAMLLELDNVRFSGSHVMVDGKIGNYSIHLGSGQVHRQPGGSVCIIPVGSQHRGRLFLPFADDDPRTAEVVSKTVLLARDDQIKDPTILEQIL